MGDSTDAARGMWWVVMARALPWQSGRLAGEAMDCGEPRLDDEEVLYPPHRYVVAGPQTPVSLAPAHSCRSCLVVKGYPSESVVVHSHFEAGPYPSSEHEPYPRPWRSELVEEAKGSLAAEEGL